MVFNSSDLLLFIPKQMGRHKLLINILEKMLEDNPKDWHKILSKTLWAYRTSKRDSIGVSPYSITYGQDAMLPMEVVVHFLRLSR